MQIKSETQTIKLPSPPLPNKNKQKIQTIDIFLK